MTRTQVAETGSYPAAVIRPVRSSDLAVLSDFFAGLSMQSRYQRFFAPVTPGPALLRLLSGGAGVGGTVDAMIAIADGGIVGHAMAADRAPALGGRTTDIGVVVADAWQGRGVGSALMRALIAGARARGVASLTMDVLPANRRVLAMITGHWPAARIDRAAACQTVCLALAQDQQLARHPAREDLPPAPIRTGQAGRSAGRRYASSPRRASPGTRR